MSTEDNIAIARALEEAMDRHDLSFMEAHPGLVESKPFFQQLFAAFPDMTNTVETTVATDEWVAQRIMVGGTMRGEFMGMAPTGKHATWEVINMFRIADGTIVESHGQADVMGVMQQLGIAPNFAQQPH